MDIFIWTLCILYSWNVYKIETHRGTTTLHPFNGLFSRTTWVSRYQTGKTSLYLKKQEIMGFGVAVASAEPYDHIPVQTDNHCRLITTPTPHHSIFTRWLLFLTANQQCQCTEGKVCYSGRLIENDLWLVKCANSNDLGYLSGIISYFFR